MRSYLGLFYLLLASNGWKRALAQDGEQCESAIPLSPGDFVSSSTVNATMEGADNQIDLIRCNDDGFFSIDNPGVWFVYEATTSRDLKLSTCAQETNFANRITAFAMGQGDCSNRACAASSLTEDSDCPFENSTVLEFSVAAGTTYAIFVNDEFADDAGDFRLSVVDVSPPPVSVSCDEAIELSHNETTQGTTVGATVPIGLQNVQCVEVAPTNPGVFLYIPPVEERSGLSIALTGAEVLFDIIVFEGTSCEDLQCRQVDVSSEGITVFASWLAEEGKGFYIYVFAADRGEENLTDRFGVIVVHDIIQEQGSASSSIHFLSLLALNIVAMLAV